MKVSVAEAMRIKNLLGAKIKSLSGWEAKNRYMEATITVSFGVTEEDGQTVSDEGSLRSDDFIHDLETLTDLSFKVNTALSAFNDANKVTEIVRERQNLKLLVKAMEHVAKGSKPSTKTRFEVIGDKRVAIPVKFSPFVDLADLESKIDSSKEKIRQLQVQLDALNSSVIEVDISEGQLRKAGV